MDVNTAVSTGKMDADEDRAVRRSWRSRWSSCRCSSTGFGMLFVTCASWRSSGLYVMLALGLNIVVGYAGLLDLGYIAFYAMGAYAGVHRRRRQSSSASRRSVRTRTS